MTTNKISVVSPVYGARESLPALCLRLKKALSQLTEHFEIILVNDNCPSNSWDEILKLCSTDTRVKGINLSKNFGQHSAITAGLEHTTGAWVVVMDCDLQDQPEEIIKLYNKAQEGYDIVMGQRVDRKDSAIKRYTSKFFYMVLNYLTDLNHDQTVANFGIYSQKVIQSILKYREQNRAFPFFVHLVGFKKTEIPIIHVERDQGKSSYSFKKRLNLAIDSIITHSNKPLRLSIKFGAFISIASVFYACWLVIGYFIYATPVAGWTSLIVVLFFMFGILFGVLGILGLYIGKIFDETKERPLYLIQEKLNFGEE